MRQKKIPMRMCVLTHERLPKNDLIRIVKTDDDIIVDPTGKVNGHGIYLKKDVDVINNARIKKALDKIFLTEVSDEVYDKIIELI